MMARAYTPVATIAAAIVKDIVRDLGDRSGFGNLWEELEPDVQAEIRATWREIITRHISKTSGA